MDKLFLASVVARERKNEITKELSIQHMLREGEPDAPQVSKRMVLRLAPTLILVSLLLLFLIA
jgi:hypothetical protein